MQYLHVCLLFLYSHGFVKDDYYDDEEGNEEDIEDDLNALGVPVDSLATVLTGRGGEGFKLNWKQVSSLDYLCIPLVSCFVRNSSLS